MTKASTPEAVAAAHARIEQNKEEAMDMPKLRKIQLRKLRVEQEILNAAKIFKAEYVEQIELIYEAEDPAAALKNGVENCIRLAQLHDIFGNANSWLHADRLAAYAEAVQARLDRALDKMSREPGLGLVDTLNNKYKIAAFVTFLAAYNKP